MELLGLPGGLFQTCGNLKICLHQSSSNTCSPGVLVAELNRLRGGASSASVPCGPRVTRPLKRGEVFPSWSEICAQNDPEWVTELVLAGCRAHSGTRVPSEVSLRKPGPSPGLRLVTRLGTGGGVGSLVGLHSESRPQGRERGPLVVPFARRARRATASRGSESRRSALIQ